MIGSKSTHQAGFHLVPLALHTRTKTADDCAQQIQDALVNCGIPFKNVTSVTTDSGETTLALAVMAAAEAPTPSAAP